MRKALQLTPRLQSRQKASDDAIYLPQGAQHRLRFRGAPGEYIRQRPGTGRTRIAADPSDRAEQVPGDGIIRRLVPPCRSCRRGQS